MNDYTLFKLAAASTRKWRDMEIHLIAKTGHDDLSYRPKTGMSSLGWVLAHQAAVFDFSLNMLIKAGPPKRPDLFKLYNPSTAGDWAGTSLEEIKEYYESGELELLEFAKNASEDDFETRIKEGKAPSFFVGMTIREVITGTFTHIDYHTGHLTSIRKELQSSE